MKVNWTANAKEDRENIVEYIAHDNPRAALKIDDLFSEAASRLADFPKLGKTGQIQGTRELLPHESYRLIYEIDEANDTIWVIALVHTSRQWPPVPVQE